MVNKNWMVKMGDKSVLDRFVTEIGWDNGSSSTRFRIEWDLIKLLFNALKYIHCIDLTKTKMES